MLATVEVLLTVYLCVLRFFPKCFWFNLVSSKCLCWKSTFLHRSPPLPPFFVCFQTNAERRFLRERVHWPRTTHHSFSRSIQYRHLRHACQELHQGELKFKFLYLVFCGSVYAAEHGVLCNCPLRTEPHFHFSASKARCEYLWKQRQKPSMFIRARFGPFE